MKLASTDARYESLDEALFAEKPAGVSWFSVGTRPGWACKTLKELTCQEADQALTLLASLRPADEVLARVLVDRLGHVSS